MEPTFTLKHSDIKLSYATEQYDGLVSGVGWYKNRLVYITDFWEHCSPEARIDPETGREQYRDIYNYRVYYLHGEYLTKTLATHALFELIVYNDKPKTGQNKYVPVEEREDKSIHWLDYYHDPFYKQWLEDTRLPPGFHNNLEYIGNYGSIDDWDFVWDEDEDPVLTGKPASDT